MRYVCLASAQASMLPATACARLPAAPRAQHVLQGEEDYEAVPCTQFVVSRTAHANNSSNYYLGDKRSSYGEVVDLLKSRGIDLDNNRFLILQVLFVRRT